MLFLALIAVSLGVVVGLLRGGHPANLRNLRLRGLWFVFVPLALQYALFMTPLGAALGPAQGPAHILAYGLLLVPIALNLHVWGMKLVALGLALNVIVIGANGGYMPVSANALHTVGATEYAQALEAGQRIGKSTLMAESSRLPVFGDWLPVPLMSNVISPGDIAILIGGLALIVGGMGRRRA